MLLFKKKFLDLIRRGEKTQTLRIWPHRKMRVGQRSYIPGAGYITIEAVDEVEPDDQTDVDAQLDGFAALGPLREEIARLYPDGLGDDKQLFRIRFRVLSPQEQAAAIQERQQRKKQPKKPAR